MKRRILLKEDNLAALFTKVLHLYQLSLAYRGIETLFPSLLAEVYVMLSVHISILERFAHAKSFRGNAS